MAVPPLGYLSYSCIISICEFLLQKSFSVALNLPYFLFIVQASAPYIIMFPKYILNIKNILQRDKLSSCIYIKQHIQVNIYN